MFGPKNIVCIYILHQCYIDFQHGPGLCRYIYLTKKRWSRLKSSNFIILDFFRKYRKVYLRCCFIGGVPLQHGLLLGKDFNRLKITNGEFYLPLEVITPIFHQFFAHSFIYLTFSLEFILPGTCTLYFINIICVGVLFDMAL